MLQAPGHCNDEDSKEEGRCFSLTFDAKGNTQFAVILSSLALLI